MTKTRPIAIGSLISIAALLVVMSLRKPGSQVHSEHNQSPRQMEIPVDQTQLETPLKAGSKKKAGNGGIRGFTAAERDVRNSELMACMDERKCPDGTLCHLDPVDGRLMCFGSNCRSLADADSCGPDRMCLAFSPAVYRCVRRGNARAGERCNDVYPAPASLTCGPGLACWQGRCRVPCGPGGACAGTDRCVAWSDLESLCVDAACKTTSDCGAGRACVRAEDEVKSCVTEGRLPSGERSCTPESCPAGQVCDGMITGGDFVGRCRRTCSEIPTIPCPSGQVCGMAGIWMHQAVDAPSVCYQACSFETMRCDTPGEVCSTVTEDMTWTKAGCVLDPPISMPPHGSEDEHVFKNPVAAPADK